MQKSINPSAESVTKTKSRKSSDDKIPFESVKHFSNIDLQRHISTKAYIIQEVDNLRCKLPPKNTFFFNFNFFHTF